MNKKIKKINAAILIIGNEILSGRTQDKNISFISLLGEPHKNHNIVEIKKKRNILLKFIFICKLPLIYYFLTA